MSLGVDAKRLSHRIMHTTVRIECLTKNGKPSTGTGFILRTRDDVLLIITNNHVIKDCTSGEFVIAERDRYNEPILGRGITVSLNNFPSRWSLHPNPEVDLACMPFKPVVLECSRIGRPAFFTSIDSNTIPSDEEWKKLISIEDILMIGYPNGLWDEFNNIPFFMKGMTATHPNINYKGTEEFVIHMPVYKGSSGSPIFLLSEQFYSKARSYDQGQDFVRLLGIAYKHFRYKVDGKIIAETDHQDLKLSSEVLLDLGVAIRSTRLKEFDSVIGARYGSIEELRL